MLNQNLKRHTTKRWKDCQRSKKRCKSQRIKLNMGHTITTLKGLRRWRLGMFIHIIQTDLQFIWVSCTSWKHCSKQLVRSKFRHITKLLLGRGEVSSFWLSMLARSTLFPDLVAGSIMTGLEPWSGITSSSSRCTSAISKSSISPCGLVLSFPSSTMSTLATSTLSCATCGLTTLRWYKTST